MDIRRTRGGTIMTTWTFEVVDGEHGYRLDKWLPLKNKEWSRSQVQTWLKEGNVTVNGAVEKPKYRVQIGDEIIVNEPAPVELDVVAEDLNLSVIYEDEDIAIVSKPRGMVVHPSLGHPRGTLVNGLMYALDDLSGINGVLRPGIVHRLDKDTTGLLVVAKNDEAHRHLADQFSERTAKREYIALVHGHIPHEKGLIDAPIGRDPKERQRMAVVDEGKPARTHFEVKEHLGDEYTLVTCQLETGRTHQIRVHFDYIEHPLVGDETYGRRKPIPLGGQFLHASTIGFVHPRTEEYVEWTSPLPEDADQLLQQLRKETD